MVRRRRRSPKHVFIGLAVVAWIVALASCVPAPSGEERRRPPDRLAPISAYAARPLPVQAPWYPLVGRNDFSDDALTAEQAVWHRRLREAIEASRDGMVRRAERDDAYDFGRWLYQYDHALLMALRMTGDLRFLDEVDLVAQAMRSRLRDGWCGGVRTSVYVNARYGSVREPDGYLNFRLGGVGVRDACRDTGDLDEALVHGHLAMVMYAYHVNRDLQSPAGIDYGERADFWLDYLRNHFEAKWRERSRTPWPAMDFLDVKFCHTYHQMLLYHYFVGRRLASDGSADATPYLWQALRMSEGMFTVPYGPGVAPGGFVEVDTPSGPAFVYSFGSPSSGYDVSAVSLESCATTYARYMLSSVLTLRMEGFPGWDDRAMAKLTNGLAHLVVDTLPIHDRERPFAAGVSGAAVVAGMPPTALRDRLTASTFAITPFAAYVAWDPTERIEDAVAQVYGATETDEEAPTQVFLPAGMLVARSLDLGGP